MSAALVILVPAYGLVVAVLLVRDAFMEASS